MSCGVPRGIAGEERDDTMESRDVIVSGGEVERKVQGMKMEQQKQQKASDKT